MKKVSVITPTKNRPEFLRLAKQCFLAQTYKNIEWLILDDSDLKNEEFSNLIENNIVYIHSAGPLSIGEKRNRLIDQSTGEVIVHFDDDDYYLSNYVEKFVATLESENSDLLNLRSFFLCNAWSGNFAYWDLTVKEGLHFKMFKEDVELVMLDSTNNKGFQLSHFGFGFGWTYRKSVWKENPFLDINWNEDGEFSAKARKKFKLDGLMDADGICLHFLHKNSSSMCFPQYILPPRLLKNFFPLDKVGQYLKASAF